MFCLFLFYFFFVCIIFIFVFFFPSPVLAGLEAAEVVQCAVGNLEARLATLRDGVVDQPTTERAVEQAQVSTFTVLICDQTKTNKKDGSWLYYCRLWLHFIIVVFLWF